MDAILWIEKTKIIEEMLWNMVHRKTIEDDCKSGIIVGQRVVLSRQIE